MTHTPEFAPPTPDEKVMGALSHIGILMPMIGAVIPVIIWVTQKEKSRFVAFQALQAMAYQFAMIVSWIIGMGCYMVSFFTTFLTIPLAEMSESPDSVSFIPFLGFFFPFIVFGLIFLIGFLFILYGIIATVMVFQGKNFHYVLIGRQVEKYMQPRPAPPAD